MTEPSNDQPTGVNPPTASVLPPRSVPAGHGLAWMKSGFTGFRLAPWVWIGIALLFLVVTYVLGLVPIGSLLLCLVSPVLTGGIMLGCRALDEGEPLSVSHLFAGFQHRTRALISAGALYLGLLFAVALVAGMLGAVIGVEIPDAPVDGQELPVIDGMLAVLVLLVMLLIIPLAMAFYYAPALLALNDDMRVTAAFKLSLSACLKNIMPFLVYGLLGLLLGLLAVATFGLGLLVVVPVIYAGMYVSYKDIFLGEDP